MNYAIRIIKYNYKELQKDKSRIIKSLKKHKPIKNNELAIKLINTRCQELGDALINLIANEHKNNL